MRSLKLLLIIMLLIQAAFSQTPTLDTLTIPSKVFNANRKVVVALPSGYTNNPDQQYIVAYLFDSQSSDFFNFYWSTIKYLTHDGYVQPFILVGVISDNRQYEFTPKAQTPQGLKNFQKSGGASLLANHLNDEVLPLIKQKYHTSGYNIGIGHSLGATFVSYAMLNRPEIFNAGIAISPNYQYDNLQMVHQFDSLATGKTLNHKFFYLAHGSGDAYEDNFKTGANQVDSILKKRNIPGLRWTFKSMDNDSHGTTAMEGIFKGLVALYRELTISDMQMNAFYKDQKKPLIENIKSYYQAASNWSGLKLPLVNDLNNMGYNCFYAAKNNEAIAMFKWALALYPDNINLYDSMAEIEANTGDKKEALNYYTKGLETVKKQQSLLSEKRYTSQITYFEKKIKAFTQQVQ